MIRLVSRFELASRNTPELHGLYREMFNALARTAPGTADRRNALASLETIAHEIRIRVLSR